MTCSLIQMGLMTAVSLMGATSLASAQEPPAGLLVDLPLDGDLRDAAVAGREATASGAVGFAPGREGAQALSLDGQGGYVSAGTNLPELGDTFTVECWVKPAAGQRPYADILGNHDNEFVGCAIQQDGEQDNHYYFTYGTGQGWVYSHTFGLEPDVWQHVAIVKSEGRQRVYINGMLADAVAAPLPMATSPTPFMVGLGIKGPQRFFKGQVAGVRVWSTAVRPVSNLSPEEQVAQFARSARVEREASARWLLFRAEGRGTLTFSMDPEAVPEAVEGVRVSFGDGGWGALELNRGNGFEATVAVPPEPGLHTLRYQADALAGGRALQMQPGELTYLVLRPAGGQTGTPAQTGDAVFTPSRVMSLNGPWQLATDPDNAGIEAGWPSAPVAEAVTSKVPWIIQDAFPGYHGVAWYWRSVNVPATPHPGGRTLLRFEAVDYKADVWVNGQPVGTHEGGETPFEVDITGAARPGESNLVAVRVVNPTHTPIDDLTLNTTPRRAKVIPYSPGASYNHGGIVGAVELVQAPAAYLRDLHLIPDPATGLVRVRALARNAAAETRNARLVVSIAPAASGETLDARQLEASLAPGEETLELTVRIPEPRLWELDDPYLYRVTARLVVGDAADERSDRCGLRDFRYSDGYFRLNGKRIFLRSSHTVNAAPVGQQVPDDPALFQRDLLLMKTMGFNCIRFIWGGATKRQLDMCDEMGLMVYQEHAASNPMQDTLKMGERFDMSVGETILRDRNHASVVIWGLLNETQNGPVFQHASRVLPLVRSLDETRMVMLNSGRWDGQWDIGSICNPGAAGWDSYMGGEAPGAGPSSWGPAGGYFRQAGDAHIYPRVPQVADTTKLFRELGHDTGPVFLTEYGIGSAVDLWRITRQFEALGKAEAEDAQFYRGCLEHFESNWDSWRMGECFADPQDFFAASLARMAGQRTLGLDAIRSNPKIIGYSLTGMMDHVNCGEGLFTLFRELKPGTTDALAEGFAPLRLCVFAEPPNVARGGTVHVEGVLANEDALGSGEYPVRVQVIAPDMSRALDTVVTVTVPESKPGQEAPLAIPFYAGDVVVDGPAGEYRFVATMLSGGAPTGGRMVFHVWEPAAPKASRVTLLGDDASVRGWLTAHGVTVTEFGAGPGAEREVILVAGRPGGDEVAGWRDLAARMARGATVLFIAPEALSRGDQPAGWLPLAQKGTFKWIQSWLYLKEEWAKQHPVFAGLPAGGLMDFGVYRDIIPDLVLDGQPAPDEAIVGTIKASQGYESGMEVLANRFGAGRWLVSTLRIRECLGKDPVADRLLANLLDWAATEATGPLAGLPGDFESTLEGIGYR